MRDPAGARDETIDQIRRTYGDYLSQGRDRLWDPTNPGYARMVRARDRALLDLIRRSLPPGGAVLDLGCGPGELADLVRGNLGDVYWTGVDLLTEPIAAARRARRWATWIEASADLLPLEDASFDVVVAATLFSSLPTRELERAVATEVDRVLRPNGWLIWYDLRWANPRNAAVHGIRPSILRRLFPGWRQELVTITLLPPLARRLGITTPIAYPLLVRLPFLRSHLIGRLQRPG